VEDLQGSAGLNKAEHAQELGSALLTYPSFLLFVSVHDAKLLTKSGGALSKYCQHCSACRCNLDAAGAGIGTMTRPEPAGTDTGCHGKLYQETNVRSESSRNASKSNCSSSFKDSAIRVCVSLKCFEWVFQPHLEMLGLLHRSRAIDFGRAKTLLRVSMLNITILILLAVS
jgi:hypothetical protein